MSGYNRDFEDAVQQEMARQMQLLGAGGSNASASTAAAAPPAYPPSGQQYGGPQGTASRSDYLFGGHGDAGDDPLPGLPARRKVKEQPGKDYLQDLKAQMEQAEAKRRAERFGHAKDRGRADAEQPWPPASNTHQHRQAPYDDRHGPSAPADERDPGRPGGGRYPEYARVQRDTGAISAAYGRDPGWLAPDYRQGGVLSPGGYEKGSRWRDHMSDNAGGPPQGSGARGATFDSHSRPNENSGSGLFSGIGKNERDRKQKDVDAKKAYAEELKRQIQEREANKPQPDHHRRQPPSEPQGGQRDSVDDVFGFGPKRRGGGGEPLRNREGQVITALHPVLNKRKLGMDDGITPRHDEEAQRDTRGSGGGHHGGPGGYSPFPPRDRDLGPSPDPYRQHVPLNNYSPLGGDTYGAREAPPRDTGHDHAREIPANMGAEEFKAAVASGQRFTRYRAENMDPSARAEAEAKRNEKIKRAEELRRQIEEQEREKKLRKQREQEEERREEERIARERAEIERKAAEEAARERAAKEQAEEAANPRPPQHSPVPPAQKNNRPQPLSRDNFAASPEPAGGDRGGDRTLRHSPMRHEPSPQRSPFGGGGYGKETPDFDFPPRDRFPPEDRRLPMDNHRPLRDMDDFGRGNFNASLHDRDPLFPPRGGRFDPYSDRSSYPSGRTEKDEREIHALRMETEALREHMREQSAAMARLEAALRNNRPQYPEYPPPVSHSPYGPPPPHHGAPPPGPYPHQAWPQTQAHQPSLIPSYSEGTRGYPPYSHSPAYPSESPISWMNPRQGNPIMPSSSTPEPQGYSAGHNSYMYQPPVSSVSVGAAFERQGMQAPPTPPRKVNILEGHSEHLLWERPGSASKMEIGPDDDLRMVGAGRPMTGAGVPFTYSPRDRQGTAGGLEESLQADSKFVASATSPGAASKTFGARTWRPQSSSKQAAGTKATAAKIEEEGDSEVSLPEPDGTGVEQSLVGESMFVMAPEDTGKTKKSTVRRSQEGLATVAEDEETTEGKPPVNTQQRQPQRPPRPGSSSSRPPTAAALRNVGWEAMTPRADDTTDRPSSSVSKGPIARGSKEVMRVLDAFDLNGSHSFAGDMEGFRMGMSMAEDSAPPPPPPEDDSLMGSMADRSMDKTRPGSSRHPIDTSLASLSSFKALEEATVSAAQRKKDQEGASESWLLDSMQASHYSSDDRRPKMPPSTTYEEQLAHFPQDQIVRPGTSKSQGKATEARQKDRLQPPSDDVTGEESVGSLLQGSPSRAPSGQQPSSTSSSPSSSPSSKPKSRGWGHPITKKDVFGAHSGSQRQRSRSPSPPPPPLEDAEEAESGPEADVGNPGDSDEYGSSDFDVDVTTAKQEGSGWADDLEPDLEGEEHTDDYADTKSISQREIEAALGVDDSLEGSKALEHSTSKNFAGDFSSNTPPTKVKSARESFRNPLNDFTSSTSETQSRSARGMSSSKREISGASASSSRLTSKPSNLSENSTRRGESDRRAKREEMLQEVMAQVHATAAAMKRDLSHSRLDHSVRSGHSTSNGDKALGDHSGSHPASGRRSARLSSAGSAYFSEARQERPSSRPSTGRSASLKITVEDGEGSTLTQLTGIASPNH